MTTDATGKGVTPHTPSDTIKEGSSTPLGTRIHGASWKAWSALTAPLMASYQYPLDTHMTTDATGKGVTPHTPSDTIKEGSSTPLGTRIHGASWKAWSALTAPLMASYQYPLDTHMTTDATGKGVTPHTPSDTIKEGSSTPLGTRIHGAKWKAWSALTAPLMAV